jgi:tetratricopeptide (TPR) repeat protein
LWDNQAIEVAMRRTLGLLLLAALDLTCVQAQKGAPPVGGGTRTSGGTTSGPVTTPAPGVPNVAPSQPTPAPSPSTNSRPIFISGTVAMDDGSPLPGGVEIQSVCGAGQRNVAHAGITGNFSFQWNDTAAVFQDAANGQDFTPDRSPGFSNSFASLDPTGNCELRAAVSGYTSSRAALSDHAMSSNLDVGTIVLHRLTGDEGRTVSLTALKAPRDAAKNFQKGTAQARAKKLPDAAASFQKALAIYPRYADAWLSLGLVEMQTGAREAARNDFQKAMDLDAKMVGPWQQLGYIASDESKWADAAKYLDQAVRLDPTDSPQAWYFNAMANYNLGHFDVAERSVRSGITLNGDRNPHAEYLLGLVLIAKKDLAGGAEVLRKYIEKWPQSGEVESAKMQLSRIGSEMSMSGQQ